MRVRRLAVAAIAAVLGAGSLAACGTGSPDVAAYVGDTTYQLSQVDAVYDEVQQSHGDRVRQAYAAENDAAKQRAEQTGAEAPATIEPSPQDLLPPVTRQDVVSLLVSVDLGRQVLADEQLQAPTGEVSGLAGALGVEADSEYAALWTEWYGILLTLEENLAPADYTDEAVTAVYAPLVDAGALPQGLTVEQVRQQFGDGSFVRSAVALRDALAGKADEIGVRVNPRFDSLAAPLLVPTNQGAIFYDLSYLPTGTPVTDAPAQTETPAEPAGDGHDH
ncbi:hypothetical protein [Melissospora conviva]|uniref:hypothetical protein n=1 Tax=Melissospora conviva TaxID=3388432 RepID=UPI003C178C7F